MQVRLQRYTITELKQQNLTPIALVCCRCIFTKIKSPKLSHFHCETVTKALQNRCHVCLLNQGCNKLGMQFVFADIQNFFN